MRKRSRKRLSATEVASSDPEISPDATLDPGASLDQTSAVWKVSESTNAPVVGERDEPSQVYAQNYPELLDRMLRDKTPFRSRFVYLIIVLAWFGVECWLFLQDNEAGLLATVEGLMWFAWKTAAFAGLTVLTALIVAVVFWLTRPPAASS